MADTFTVEAQPREVEGKKVRALRRQGIIPANLFGRGRDSRSVQVTALEVKRILAKHAGTRILNLRVNGASDTVLIRHIQREPKSGAIQHIDFMHVDMKEKMHAKVLVTLVGDAPAIKAHSGVLLHVLDAVEVECLPADLPEGLELDVTGMEELDSTLHVRDLTAPKGVQILSDADEVVAKIEKPRILVEEAPAVEAEAPAEETPAEGASAEE